MKKVVAPIQAKILVVCPTCGEMIEVEIEGLTNYKTERVDKDETQKR